MSTTSRLIPLWGMHESNYSPRVFRCHGAHAMSQRESLQHAARFEPIPSAILALTLFAAAYLSENFRGGVLGVDKGQWETASSMGMPYWRTCRGWRRRIAMCRPD